MNLSTQMAKRVANRPYRLLAQFYDQLSPFAPAMNRHARQQILGKILPQVRSVCDLGCGTGTTAIDFARRGRKVFAVDNSPTMCRLARQKARRAGVSVRVFCADMKTFRLPERVDLVTCEFSAINHVPRKADLVRVAGAVAQALRPGGYFSFDVDTRRTYEKMPQLTHWTEKRDFVVVLHGTYDRRREEAWLELDWFLREGKLWRRSHERAKHVCWTDAEIRHALRRAGFHRIRAWDAVRVRPTSCKSRPGYDTYYLAQKSLNKRRKN